MNDIPSKERIAAFLNLKSSKELAQFLNIEPNVLTYYFYHVPDETKYHTFSIKRKNGKKRIITAPNNSLRKIQRKLQPILQQLYLPKACVHGFIKNKSIITNAKYHLKKKILVNIDLSNFFQSINFGRVRGIFLNHPFNFNEEVSTTLAQLCCFKGSLPQGAPTSPIISNFICRKLDNDFIRLCKENKLHYTRYADDITFSTNLKKLPKTIGLIENNKLTLASNITSIIDSNNFEVNQEKIRYAYRENRQEVTGLVVNSIVNVKRDYIRQIRAMLRSWEKHGLYNSAVHHYTLHKAELKQSYNIETAFLKKLVGKINFVGHVKGKGNSVYINLFKRIKALEPTVKLSIIEREIDAVDLPILLTEGKSDGKHIAAALSYFKSLGQFTDLNLNIHEYKDESKMSNGELLKMCEALSKLNNKYPIICLFDRDVPSFLANVTVTDEFYKDWGNKVFSMALPIPSHRAKMHDICIEHYYTDKEIITADKNGRRIFFSSEFDKISGKHKNLPFTLKNLNSLKSNREFIIDSGVLNEHNNSVALSKNRFAECIFNKEEEFKSINFNGFHDLFLNFEHLLAKEKKPLNELVY